ncbi:DUF2357 domain-containing protein [Micromonospora sp. CPCC 205561]|uniref:DUF2357 domain-containing protein n=1 Tax=Micromonospora sp. CPCC 205561 TaxID=3122407 RepID=UPI002FF0DB85
MSGVEWYDRLTGRRLAALPAGPATVGRYLLHRVPPGTTLDGRPVGPGDYLASVPDERWSLHLPAEARTPAGGRGRTVGGQSRPHGEPEPVVVDTILTIAARLAATAEAGGSAQEWAEQSPLIAEPRERLNPTRLDEEIRSGLNALVAVARNPADRLRVVREVTRVDRATRIATTATAHLSQHSEYWQVRTVRGVRPSHVLALRFDDDIDLYENRLAGRLLERLAVYLASRIREVEDIARLVARLVDHRQVERPSWRNAFRFALLLDGMATHSDRVIAEATEFGAVLRGWLGQVHALRGSRLVKGVNRNAHLPITVQRTNLINNDDRYRRVGGLWTAWTDEVHSRTVDRSRQQRFAVGFERYCALLVLRACEYLRMEVGAAPAPSRSGPPLPLHRDAVTYHLGWGPDGVLTLTGQEPGDEHAREPGHGRALVRFVPLPHAVTNRGGAVAAVLDELAQADASTVVLYPGTAEDRAALPVGTRLWAFWAGFQRPADAAGGEPYGPLCVPVSPLESDSLERVARALRWVVDVPDLLAYPPVLGLPDAAVGPVTAASTWLRVEDGQLFAVRPPRFDEFEAARGALRLWADRESRRGARVSPTDAETGLAAARDALTRIATCPTCGVVAGGHDFDAWQGRTFHATCGGGGGCGTEWGVNACGDCRGRYPVLWYGSAHLPGGDGDALDLSHGNDMLSAPCWLPSQRRLFVCPHCGHCGRHFAAGEAGCARGCGPAGRAAPSRGETRVRA